MIFSLSKPPSRAAEQHFNYGSHSPDCILRAAPFFGKCMSCVGISPTSESPPSHRPHRTNRSLGEADFREAKPAGSAGFCTSAPRSCGRLPTEHPKIIGCNLFQCPLRHSPAPIPTLRHFPLHPRSPAPHLTEPGHPNSIPGPPMPLQGYHYLPVPMPRTPNTQPFPPTPPSPCNKTPPLLPLAPQMQSRRQFGRGLHFRRMGGRSDT